MQTVQHSQPPPRPRNGAMFRPKHAPLPRWLPLLILPVLLVYALHAPPDSVIGSRSPFRITSLPGAGSTENDTAHPPPRVLPEAPPDTLADQPEQPVNPNSEARTETRTRNPPRRDTDTSPNTSIETATDDSPDDRPEGNPESNPESNPKSNPETPREAAPRETRPGNRTETNSETSTGNSAQTSAQTSADTKTAASPKSRRETRSDAPASKRGKRESWKRAMPGRGRISPLLSKQHLSHGAFHNHYMKPYLADVVAAHHPAPKSAVIIGFQYGADARLLGSYNIHAIEPMPKFVETFRRNKARFGHVTMHPYAASDKEGVLEVVYNHNTVVVNATRGEAVLPRGFSPTVVSADTQGSEPAALRGLGDIMTRAGSVWVEVGCRNETEGMLRWLDREYVLFDFVPWGKKRHVEGMFDRRQFAGGDRPDEIGEWVKWFCGLQEQFLWLQTDFVAVRRELMQEDLWKGFEKIGDECCGKDGGCYYRDAVRGGR